MLEQVLLTMATSAGSATLAWYLCTQYMAAEMRSNEERARERQRRAERKATSLAAKLETRVLQARLEEARGMTLVLAGMLPEMLAGSATSAGSPLELAKGLLNAGRAESEPREPAILVPTLAREKHGVRARGAGNVGRINSARS